MSENLYSPGQKSLTKEGKDNHDRIFGGIPYPEEIKEAAVEDVLRRYDGK